MVYRENPIKMDDDWGYEYHYFRKPPLSNPKPKTLVVTFLQNSSQFPMSWCLPQRIHLVTGRGRKPKSFAHRGGPRECGRNLTKKVKWSNSDWSLKRHHILWSITLYHQNINLHPKIMILHSQNHHPLNIIKVNTLYHCITMRFPSDFHGSDFHAFWMPSDSIYAGEFADDVAQGQLPSLFLLGPSWDDELVRNTRGIHSISRPNNGHIIKPSIFVKLMGKSWFTWWIFFGWIIHFWIPFL